MFVAGRDRKVGSWRTTTFTATPTPPHQLRPHLADADWGPPAASTSRTASAIRSALVRPYAKSAPARIAPQTRLRRQSASTAVAALYPGAPVTPPPGWAPEPQR